MSAEHRQQGYAPTPAQTTAVTAENAVNGSMAADQTAVADENFRAMTQNADDATASLQRLPGVSDAATQAQQSVISNATPLFPQDNSNETASAPVIQAVDPSPQGTVSAVDATNQSQAGHTADVGHTKLTSADQQHVQSEMHEAAPDRAFSDAFLA